MCRNTEFIICLFFTCTVCTVLFTPYAHGSDGTSQITDLKVSANSLEQRLKQTLKTLDLHVVELTGFPLSNDEKVPIISPRAERDIINIDTGDKALLSEIKNQLVPVLNDLKDHLIVLERYNKTLNICRPSTYVFHEHQAARKSFPIGVDSNRICEATYINRTLSKTKRNNTIPTSCKDIQQNGNNVSGIYQIQPTKSEEPIIVLCDMETHGGGWTHIHKRFDGSQDFYLEWREYKFGFGDLQGEFWLGLENIYKLTGSEVNELLVELVDRDNKKAYAHYKAFGIGPETEGYPLKVLSGHSGDAGDALTHHLGCKFSTKDFDQDSHKDHCALLCTGAWWYKDCFLSNLNGKYLNKDLSEAYKFKGLHWSGFRANEYSLSKARMMVRPTEQ